MNQTSTQSELESPSRRNFFRSMASSSSSALANGRWYAPFGEDLGKDVLWSGFHIDGQTYVVGDSGLILTLESGRLVTMESPTTLPIHALWGLRKDDLYAIGWMGVILHYDGTSWTKLAGAVINDEERYAEVAENKPLFDITGDNTGRMWAVGDGGRVLFFENNEWTALKVGTFANLRCVTVADDGCVFIGGLDGTLLVSENGKDFQAIELNIKTNVIDISAKSRQDFVAAGGRYFMDINGFKGEICFMQKGQWIEIQSDQAPTRLRSVKPVENEFLIAGDKGNMYRCDGKRLQPLEIETSHDLMGIIERENGLPYVVGDFGSVLIPLESAEDAQKLIKPQPKPVATVTWKAMENPGAETQLWGVHGLDENHVFACGEDGLVLRFDGTTWTKEKTPSKAHLHAVRYITPDCAFAVGEAGEILRYDGKEWSLHHTMPSDIIATSIWDNGQDDVFVVGDEGLIMHWDGISWTRQISGTQSALYSVWGLDSEHVLAVGDFGTVLRYNGKQWDEFNANTEHFLYNVWGRGLSDIYVVGLSGTISHFDGTRWRVSPSRVRSDLLAIQGSGEKVFAVGTAATAVRLHEGNWINEPTEAEFGLRDLWVSSTGTAFAVGDRATILIRKS